MNFVFISPNFPETYYRFCKALKNNGVRVLGVGDIPESNISNELRDALDGYYYVHDLNNLEEKKNALRYFEWHYGKIDFIESNNEHYLESDAYLIKALIDDYNARRMSDTFNAIKPLFA